MTLRHFSRIPGIEAGMSATAPMHAKRQADSPKFRFLLLQHPSRWTYYA